MTHFFERHADKTMGVISCFDRVVIQGTLPDICHPQAITKFFNGHGVRIFDFQRWAAPMRDEINENIKVLAAENGIHVEFVRKKNFRKDDRAKEILAELMCACNRRYLDFLSAVDDPSSDRIKVCLD